MGDNLIIHTKISVIHGRVRESVCPHCLKIIATNAREYPKFCVWCGQPVEHNNIDERDDPKKPYIPFAVLGGKKTVPDGSTIRCPVCKTRIYYPESNYCIECGQAIDWSEYDDVVMPKEKKVYCSECKYRGDERDTANRRVSSFCMNHEVTTGTIDDIKTHGCCKGEKW